MRKLSTRTVLLSLLFTASFCSYLYLNSVSSASVTPCCNQEVLETVSESELSDAEVTLPDVRIVKHLFSLGKRFLP